MSTPDSGLSMAQQMLREGSFPDMPDSRPPSTFVPPMRAVVAAASTMNPDAEGKVQQLSWQTGMGAGLVRHNPGFAQQRATAADLDRRDLEITNPILARQLQDVNFAGVAHDDLDSLSGIEQNAGIMRGFSEVKSLAGNINAGLLGAVRPLVDAAGVAAQGSFESPKPLMDFATGLDPDADELKDIWVRPRTWAVQQRVTQPAIDWATGGVQAGPAEQVIDPNTQRPVKNPDYRWWGRPLVNTLEQVPGTLAAFALTGKVGGAAGEPAAEAENLVGATAPGANVEAQAVPAMLGTQAAQTTYAQARAKGADQKTAVLAALSSGMTNYAMMGKMPGAVPTSSVSGAIAQWAGRSAAIGTGMTVSDNAIARGYDPGRSLTEGLPQSIASMAAFEGVGALSNRGGHNVEGSEPSEAASPSSPFLHAVESTIDAGEASKLRTRSPKQYQDFVDAQFEGDASLRIPAQDFVNYFAGKNLDPAVTANKLGIGNLDEAAAAGSDLEIPKAHFFGQLDPEHQRGLLPDLVDPTTDMTARQTEASKQELSDWVSKGGVEGLQAEYAQADAETQATPEWKSVYSDLKQRYVDAGEPETAADSYATLHANAIANLAKGAGLKADELLALHNPKMTVGEPAGMLFQSPVPEGSVDGETGNQTTLHTPSNQIPAAYRLVEADSLVPSHDAQTFERNAQYPAGVQERAYDTSKEAQARVIQQAQNYEPAYTVNSNPDAVNGPPVITPEGIVLGGNSRAMSTQRLYAKDGGAYRDYLRRNAEAFGFTSDQVDAMQKPVLVRQVAAPEETEGLRRLGSDLNKSMTGALGVSERAVSAGKSIKPETIRWAADTMNGEDLSLRELMGRHGAEIVKRLAQDGVITDRERPQFVDPSTGGLSEEGKTFVERALLGSVIDDPRLMDAAPKAVLQKLERSLGAITSFASREDEWNIAPALRGAVSELGSIQREGSSVELRLKQTSLFGGERNPVVDALVKALDGKPTAVKTAFDDFARDADQNLPGQARMFGGGEAFDAFNSAFKSKLSHEEFKDGFRSTPVVGAERERGVDGAHAADDEGVRQRTGGEPTLDSESGVRRVSQPAEAVPAAAEPAGRPLADKRGWFRVLPDGRYEIGKTSIGDLSTFVHEPAHAYLELFRELTQRDGASEPLKDDFRKISEWLGTTPEEAYKNGFTTEQHEKWATANEEYVREGKAPSAGLSRAFHNFAVWLGSIYRRASARGLVELNPEVRGVMDRLYAGEDAVNRATQEAPEPLFKTPEEAGWTPEEYRNYAETKGVSEATARKQVAAQLNEAAVRDRAEKWREEKSNVRDAVTAEIDARPEYRAIRSLRKGALEDGTGLTLNRDALVEQFGEDRTRNLNKQHRGVYRVEGGTDAETAGELLGFNSGEEMMRAMEAAPRRAVAIDQATREYMTAKHGDVRYDGSLDSKARLAVENDDRAKGLHREVTALRKKVEQLKKASADSKAALRSIATAPIAAYQEAARQMIDAKSIADLQPNRYLTASRMFSRDAFDAMRKGDAQTAAEAKHKELLNHFLFREASAARDYADKFESYTKRVQSKGIQQRLGLAQESSKVDYRDQFNWLLARYKLGPAVEAPARPLRAWADEVYGAGNEPAIAPYILNEGKYADYRNVALSEVRDLHDALINVRHLAMREFKMFVQGKQVAFAEAKESMIAAAHENLKVKPETVFAENRSLVDKALDPLRYVDARLLRQERLIEWLDGGKTGPWHDNVWNLAADAQGDEYRLQEDVTGKVTDALNDMPPEMRRRLWSEKVTVDGIPEPLPRRRLMSMAFNMGNEGNLDRLRKTFDSFGWDRNAIEKIGGMLTREEWQFVQKSWESLKPLGDRMKELETRLTGLPPSMVKVTPFKVALDDGTEMDLDGGYFPIVMDPRYSQRAIEQDSKETAQNAMQSGYVRATTSKGYTKERSGFGGPLLLDYEQALTSHVSKVTKDLSHREFMLSTQRLLLDTDVRKTLRETLGPQYESQFMPWLRTIINDNNGSVQEGLDGLKDGMQKLRGNVVAASLGFNASTSLLQVSHAPRMLLYARPASLVQSLTDFLRRPIEATREIRSLSPNEMRFRGDNLDRDIRGVLQAPDYKQGFSRKAAVAARFALEAMDHLLSHTLWRAAFNDSIAKYAELPEAEAQEKAAHEADSAVRLGLGTSAPKDLPAIMRSNEFNKFITTLYGFHNGVYNQLRDIGHQFRYDGNVGKLTYAGILTAVVPAVLGSLLTGRGPKDEENPGWWAAKRALAFSADTVPLLRSISSFMDGGHDVQLSPVEGVMQNGAKAAMEAASDKDDKDWMGIGLDAGAVATQVAGIPGSQQAVKTLRYIKRANEGKIENPNWWNAVVGGR